MGQTIVNLQLYRCINKFGFKQKLDELTNKRHSKRMVLDCKDSLGA